MAGRKKNRAIAVYLRLSVEDGDLGKDKKSESNSIERQRELIRDYIEQQIDLIGEIWEYVDDGYSGLNFDRPGFQQMLEDVKSGKIGCIIVKDLSRLGRDYLGVGYYVEEIFPEYEVRFIAVADRTDTADLTPGGTMEPGFVIINLLNNVYCWDVSKKVRASLETYWGHGHATCCSVPYGYLWDANSEAKWVIDLVASRYVRKIFDRALQGYTTAMIASMMNEEKIATPAVYAKTVNKHILDRTVSPESEKLWDAGMVRQILRRYDYTGALVMNKSRRVVFGSTAKRKTAVEEWIVYENQHDAIVTREEYVEAQAVIQPRQKKRAPQGDGPEYPLKGMVRCGNCRQKMVYDGRSGHRRFYCRHKMAVGSFSECFDGAYQELCVNAGVAVAIREMVKSADIMQKTLQKNAEQRILNMKIPDLREIEKEIAEFDDEMADEYIAYAYDEKMSREAYMEKDAEMSADLRDKEIRFVGAAEYREHEMGMIDELNGMVKKASKVLTKRGLSREMAEAFVDAVYLYDGDRMEVVFKSDEVLRDARERYLAEIGLPDADVIDCP